MISGYLRNVPLSVNGLIHIPGFGDFQMSQIDAPEDPYPVEKKLRKHNTMDEETSVRVLECADPKKQVIFHRSKTILETLKTITNCLFL